MKSGIRILSLVLCLSLCLTGCSSVQDSSPKSVDTMKDTDYSISLKAGSGFQTVAENQQFILQLRGDTAEIAVVDKASGKIFYSNPQNRDQDTLAQGEYRSLLGSQLAVTYSDSSDNFATLYSDENAVAFSQMHYAEIPDGLEVTYEFGKRESQLLAPLLLEKEKMERIRAQLDETDRESLDSIYSYVDIATIDDEYVKQQLLDVYPQLKKQPLYIISNYTSEVSDFIKEMIHEVLIKTDYTLEEMNKDAERLQIKGITAKADGNINVTVQYRLTKQGLAVNIPHDRVEYDTSSMRLTNIVLLPLFGALGADKPESYLFVPDGSGALLYANGGNKNSDAYSKPIYGYDRAVEYSRLTTTSAIRLPVFGIKDGENAFLAVVTQGDANATLNAVSANKHDGYAKVYVDFNVTPYVKPDYSTLNIWTMHSYQKRRSAGDLSVEYIFLRGEQADYVGMAKAYREWLLRERKTENVSSQSLTLSLLGAVEYPDSVAGFKVRRKAALTTYGQAEELLKQLHDKGIKDINLLYEGAINGGLYSDPSSGAEPIGILGGKKGLLSLRDTAEKLSVRLSLNSSLLYTTKKFLGGRISQTINGNTAYAYEYRLNDHGRQKLWRDYYVVSPTEYLKYLNGYLKGINRLKVADSAFLDMGVDLNSDYNSGTLTDRGETQAIIRQALGQAAELGRVTVSGGNAYVLQSASGIVNAPLKTEVEYGFDESVPFYAIATRGLVELAGEPLNSTNSRQMLLSSIETGVGLYVRWMHAENQELKKTFYNGVSLYYKPWFEETCRLYAEWIEAVGDSAGEEIIEHRNLADGLAMTTFANGKTVYVNYTDKDANVDGILVKAGSWATQTE